MRNEPDPTDPTPGMPVTVERSVVLDADVDRVLDALTTPDLLSAWLGDWTAGQDGEHVTTDDGLVRHVERIATDGPGEVAWRWSPVQDASTWSEVRFTVTTDGDRTHLTVTETTTAPVTASAGVASAAATAPAVSWMGCLMALGAVLAVGSLVAV